MSVINTLSARFISIQVCDWLTALLPSVVKNAKCQLTRVKRCRPKPPRHVSKGTVSSEYSAALADKVIIKKKVSQIFLSSFNRYRRSFPLFSGIAAVYYLHRRIHHWHFACCLHFQIIPNPELCDTCNVKTVDPGSRRSWRRCLCCKLCFIGSGRNWWHRGRQRARTAKIKAMRGKKAISAGNCWATWSSVTGVTALLHLLVSWLALAMLRQLYRLVSNWKKCFTCIGQTYCPY
jgi:hypothetical protein